MYYPLSERGIVKAVDEANLALDKGEIVGLAGESGAGKSTLMLAILRLLSPPGRVTAGQILYEGSDVLSISEEKFREQYRWKKLAMVFQGSMNGFTPVFTVGHQIKEVLNVHGRDGNDSTVNKLLSLVALDETIARRYPHELSGGQKQRAFIAMALALDPDILVADEPTTALDVITQANILNLLKELRKDLGISILLVTHDLAIISELADRLYVMYAGRVVEEGDSAEFFSKPKHPYSEGLVASTPTLTSKEIHGIPGFMPDLTKLPAGCSFASRCSFVMEKCRSERPELKRVGKENVACWLY